MGVPPAPKKSVNTKQTTSDSARCHQHRAKAKACRRPTKDAQRASRRRPRGQHSDRAKRLSFQTPSAYVCRKLLPAALVRTPTHAEALPLLRIEPVVFVLDELDDVRNGVLPTPVAVGIWSAHMGDVLVRTVAFRLVDAAEALRPARFAQRTRRRRRRSVQSRASGPCTGTRRPSAPRLQPSARGARSWQLGE